MPIDETYKLMRLCLANCQELRQLTLTDKQMELIGFIYNFGPTGIGASAIAAEFAISIQNCCVQLKRLLDKGYLVKSSEEGSLQNYCFNFDIYKDFQ